MVGDLLKQLIQIPSPSGEEKRLCSFLMEYCKERGFDPIRLDNSVIFTIGEGTDTLIFNAHIDTVTASGEWSYPPTGPDAGTEDDGKIYGLGASDNKASVAALLTAAEKLQGQGIDTTIVFSFVPEEETDGSGTKTFLDWFEDEIDPDKVAAVVTEPTGLDWIGTGCKGTTWVKAELEASGGHAAQDPVNPLQEALVLAQFVEEALPTDQEPAPSIQLTDLTTENSGSINTVPISTTAIFDVRTVPGTEHPDVLRAFNQAADELEAEAVFTLLEEPTPAADVQDGDFVDAIKETTGITESRFFNAANDSCFFLNSGIPAVVVGPGSMERAHAPDEYVEKHKLQKAVSVYSSIAEEW